MREINGIVVHFKLIVPNLLGDRPVYYLVGEFDDLKKTSIVVDLKIGKPSYPNIESLYFDFFKRVLVEAEIRIISIYKNLKKT